MDDNPLPSSLLEEIPIATSTLLGDIIASVSSSAWDTSPTSIPPLVDSPIDTLPDAANGGLDEGSYILNTIIGLVIILLASVFNALGLNLTKLDHVRQQSIPRRQRKSDWMRLLWLAGMGTYIASQVFGSPLALRYLRPDWVAPLGSSALVFNFIFAYWLVGTPVTPTDIRGTAVIVLGVILIMVFSSINHGLQQSISVDRLNSLWSRPAWLSYFLLIVLLTFNTYLVAHLFSALLASRASYSPIGSTNAELPPSRSKPVNPVVAFFKTIWNNWRKVEKRVLERMEVVFARAGDARLLWLEGIGWAVAGGSLAGLCLVFTKAVVKLLANPGHPLVHPSALVTLLFVIATAVFQIICLNKALRCADTVVVVPLFYAGYTVFGFINSLIFYDEAGQYARWVLVMVFLSIAVLITGVVLLSLKSSAKTATDPYTVSSQPSASMRMRPRQAAQKAVDAENEAMDEDEEERSERREDVLWEVGSVSDSGDEGEKERKGVGLSGVGGTGGGERRGLLGDDEEEPEEGDPPRREEQALEEDEGFGEYENVAAPRRSDDSARER